MKRLFLLLAVLVAPAIAQTAPEGAKTPVSGTIDKDIGKDIGKDIAKEIEFETFTLTFMMGRKKGSEITARIRGTDTATLDLAMDHSLLEALAMALTDQTVNEIKAHVVDGWISPKAMERIGVKAKIDLTALTLGFDAPTERRRVFRIGSDDLVINSDQDATVVAPSLFSGYVNTRASRRVDQSTTTTEQSTFNLQGVLTLGRLSAESIHQKTTGNNDSWKRQESRLVFDSPESLVHTTFGDLRIPVIGLQTALPTGGLMIDRDLSHIPSINISPVSTTGFSLANPSTVQVYVNGVLYRTLQLEAGRYELADLPLTPGVNDIDLVILDSLGRTEKISFPFVSEYQLLRPGFNKFSLAIGAPSTQLENDISYDRKRPLASGFYSRGLSDRFTLSGYGQIGGPKEQHQSIVGLQSLMASTGALLQLGFARTENLFAQSGWGGEARLRGLPSAKDKRRFIRDWTLSYQGRDINFTPFGSALPSATFAHQFIGQFTPGFTGRTSLSIGAERDLAMPNRGELNTLKGFMTLFAPIQSGWILGGELRQEFEGSHNHETRVYVSLTWNEYSTSSSVVASYDSTRDAKRLEAFSNPGRLQGAAAIEENLTSDWSSSGRLSWNSNRFEVGANAQAIQPRQRNIPSSSAADTWFATALVFAGGARPALSAPVAGSFAVVTAESELRGTSIPVNKVTNSFLADAGGWMPGVLRNLQAYQERSLLFDTTLLASGLDLESTKFKVKPGYMNGTVVKAKLRSEVYVTGTLLKGDGVPAALVSGQIKGPSGLIGFFTDEKGYFEIEGLQAGDFTIEFFDAQLRSVVIQIPSGVRGALSIGTVNIGSLKEGGK